jgi:serine phosphatase RsbU (regulator of sigma subunit)
VTVETARSVPERAPSEVATDARRRAGLWRLIAGTLGALGLLVSAFELDCVSGNEVSSSLFYVIGIAVAAWFVGRRMGVVLACLSAAAWGLAVHLVGPGFSKPSVFYWNLGVELGIYLTAALALDSIRAGRERDRRLYEQLALVKGALDREVRAVGDLQREMLPPALPQVRGYEWQVYYTTSTQAGGDYYDFFALPDGRIGFLLGDASGHGPQAAVLMAMMRVLLHTTDEALSPPDRVLARLGHQLAQTVPAGRFATACFGVLDPSSGRIEFSLAGHPPPLLLRGTDGALEELPMLGGPPLGLFPERVFAAGSVQMRPGDTLVAYTDGVTESMSPTRALFGEGRLRETLQGGGALPLMELRQRLVARLDAHAAGTAPADDVTLLMLRRTPTV